MTKDIENMVEDCKTCKKLAPSQPYLESNLIDHEVLPGSHFGADLGSYKGVDWIIDVDRFSGYPFAKQLKKTNTEAVCKFLDEILLEYGFPMVIRSDNGP